MCLKIKTMRIQDRLQADLKTAMLAKDEDKKSIIRVMLGELSRIEKTLQPEEFEAQSISVLKRMEQNAIDLNNAVEQKIIAAYLPSMLGVSELRTIVLRIMKDNGCSSIKDMGKVMAELKSQYNGQYDGKIASDIIKESLNEIFNEENL
jgi:hypothetical protein